MEQEVFRVGIGGYDTVHVYEDKVFLERRKGFLCDRYYGGNIIGDKTIYYSDLTSIEYVKPHFLMGGHIRFNIRGERKPEIDPIENGEWDENVLDVNSKIDFENAEKIVPYMLERLDAVKSGGSVKAVSSPADEIKKYKELLDMGAITQEEFDKKKKQLLNL